MSLNFDLMEVYPIFTQIWDMMNSNNIITIVVTAIVGLIILAALRNSVMGGNNHE